MTIIKKFNCPFCGEFSASLDDVIVFGYPSETRFFSSCPKCFQEVLVIEKKYSCFHEEGEMGECIHCGELI